MSSELVRPGAIIDGRYELISMLGRGGFGDVYRAKQLTTGQLVAIKIARGIDEQSGSGIAARFKREMAVVAGLSHPNIVRLFDTGQLPDKRLYAVLQLVRGMSLSELLRQEGPLDPAETKHLMMQVLDALCSAHDLGVIHRDLKPANIMVTHVGARRNALVLDFGIATFTKGYRDDSYQSITPDGSVGGTPAYMAPEQLHGKEPNPQTDIYAWGLVFLECLTGQRVVRGNTIAETMFTHLRPDPHPMPPAVAAHPLGRVLQRALAKSAATRYVDARDALAQLTPCDVSALRRLPRPEPKVDPDEDTAAMMATADPDAPQHGPVEIISATGRRVLIDRVPTDDSYSAIPPTRQADSTSSSQKLVAERRQLTALVCELGPLGKLSELLDPDDLYTVTTQFQRIVETLVFGLEGVVERVEGGRVVSYFGYPLAHEDDASRAVQTALKIVERVAAGEIEIPFVDELASRRGQRDQAPPSLSVQAGLHTGLVVTSNIHLAKTGAVSIVDDVARLAVRLQETAGLGAVVLSQDVYRLVRDRFECAEDGERQLGAYGTVAVFRALRLADTAQIAATTDTAPSIGRSSELSTLMDRWEEVCDGRGQVVLLTGEAGIGKSHLTRVFRSRIRDSRHFWLECASSPYLTGSAFHPLIHALRIVLGFDRDDSQLVKRRKVGEFLQSSELDRHHFEEFLFALLELGEPSSVDAMGGGGVFKQPVEEQLVELLFALAEIQPVVVCLEDLHWADPSTQELAHLLVDQAPLGDLMVLATTRPTYMPEWRSRTHVIRMPLSRLSRKRIEIMVRSVAANKKLPDELVAHLAAKSDGVPLFVEEFTKAVLESPAIVEHEDRYELSGELSSLAIPATLRGSLMARLDRLGSAKEVAQVAAIIGREFTFELIESITDMPSPDLARALGQLVSSELVIQRGRPPAAKYVFKHALVQDTAYESLLEKTRRGYHARIADTLEADFPDVGQSEPELLAHHYTQAWLDDKAIRYWVRAGKRASERSAHAESIQHLRKGLVLLAKQPEGPERDKLELTLLVGLGPPLMSTQGYGSPEVEQTYSRARDLCRALEDDHDLLPALWGLWIYFQVQARYGDALEFGEQLLRLAEKLDDRELHLSAYQACGASLTITGELRRARDYFEKGLEIYDRRRHRHLAFMYGQDPGMYCSVFLGWVLFAQGFPDRAVASVEKGIELARRVEHPNSLAFAMCMSLKVFEARGDLERIRELADEAIDLATEYRLMHWLAFAKFMRGYVRAEQDEGEDGIDDMVEALAEWRARARASLPFFHSLLAKHMGRSGQVSQGLALQAEVPAAGHDNRAVYYEATWKRIRAELLLARSHPGDRDQAETLLRETIARARERGDRMAELAALGDLIELLRRLDAAHNVERARLAELCVGLTEGETLPTVARARRIIADASS